MDVTTRMMKKDTGDAEKSAALGKFAGPQPAVDAAQLQPWLGERSLDDWLQQFDKQGYVIFPRVLPEKDVERVRAALKPHMTKQGRNNFEGFKSNRVYALLAKAPEVFSDMAAHPLPLFFAERDVGRSCLLSALLAINSQPGETVQPWHHDDSHIQMKLPRASFGVSAFWAIDAMTDTNGATEVLPGSHLWGEAERPSFVKSDLLFKAGAENAELDPQPRADVVKAVMPAGSVMLAKGTLWHRGGANRSDKARLIVTPQYCPGWARQLENHMLTTPREACARVSRRTRELMGYSIHGGFMGYADGVHPERFLSA